jgi:hypothetical protein
VNELVEWLRAQLDEDERVAKAVARQADLRPSRRGRTAQWSAYLEGGDDGWAIESADGDHSFVVVVESVAHHIARHDPARVLVEVEAKRRLLDWLVQVAAVADADSYPIDSDTALRLLATVYADRPGYRDEWRPA